MVRSLRQWPSVYFGRPGALVTMPWPRGDIDKPYDRQVFDFITGSGQHLISTTAQGSRPYTVTWNALHADNFRAIEQYWAGQMGVGPWAFIDPSMNNMLLPNQAAATNNLMATTGWATSTGAANMGTLLSSATQIHRTGATRALRWQFPVTAATTPILTLSSPYRNWYGFPAVTGLPYSWSFWARPDGVVDTSITLAAKIQWLDSTGVQIGADVSGGDIVMSSGFVQLSVTGTAPSNTAYIKPILVATGSTITVGGSIYADEFLLEQDSVVNTWAPGTGLRPVEILGLPETTPFDARWRTGLALTLRELVA